MAAVQSFTPDTPSGTYSCAFISAGELATGHHKLVRVWDVPSGTLTHSFAAHTGIVWDILHHSGTLYTAGNDNRVCAWDVGSWDQLASLAVPDHACRLAVCDARLLVGVYRCGVHAFARDGMLPLGLVAEHKDEIMGIFPFQGVWVSIPCAFRSFYFIITPFFSINHSRPQGWWRRRPSSHYRCRPCRRRAAVRAVCDVFVFDACNAAPRGSLAEFYVSMNEPYGGNTRASFGKSTSRLSHRIPVDV